MTIPRIALLVAAALALAVPARAQFAGLEPSPAATLLLPYFEVDLNNPNGITTLLSVNNASAAPALANVVLWTDYSFPTVGFSVYLTGYDVQTINLRDIFQGNLPITGPTVFAAGPLSDPNISPPNCDAILPFSNPELSPTQLLRVVNGHTGQFVPTLNACIGRDHHDGVARGYVTIDHVAACSLATPLDVGYFIDGGLGIASDVNQLWGDFFIVDGLNNFAFGEPLVHIKANAGLNAVQVPLLNPSTGATATTVANATGYTFYGRYTAPTGARQPPAPRHHLGLALSQRRAVRRRHEPHRVARLDGRICQSERHLVLHRADLVPPERDRGDRLQRGGGRRRDLRVPA